MNIAIFVLPVEYSTCKEANLLFYIKIFDGFLLLGIEIFHQSYQLGPESILHIPSNVLNISEDRFILRTSFEPTVSREPHVGRTYLQFLPANLSSIKSFRTTEWSVLWKKSGWQVQSFCGEEPCFSSQWYSHLHFDNMVFLCELSKILTPSPS